MKLQLLAITSFMLFGAHLLFAATIVGTQAELTCVFSYRDALSLGRLVDPVPIFVPSCIENYTDGVATDRTHAHLEHVRPIPHSGDIPPVAEWPVYSLAELDRIECRLDRWRADNPDATPTARIRLDLSKTCEDGGH